MAGIDWCRAYHDAQSEISELTRKLAEAHEAANTLRPSARNWEALREMVVDVYEDDLLLQAWLPNPRRDLAAAVAALLDRVRARPLSAYTDLAKTATLRRAACEGRLEAWKVDGVWHATESAVRSYLERMRPRRRRS